MTGITNLNTDANVKINRITTGINGLDTLIEGGVPRNSITLVSGPPGCGKSIFCFQFLYEGIKNNEKCLFITLDKNAEGLITQSKQIGLDFQDAIENNQIKFLHLNIYKKYIYETMTNEIISGNYDRIVIDSITPLSEVPIYIRKELDNKIDTSMIDFEEFPDNESMPTRRLHLRYIITILESTESTSVITSELPVGSTLLSRDGISEFLADAVISLAFDSTMDRRKLSIMKMRNTKHSLKPHDIAIDYGGLKLI